MREAVMKLKCFSVALSTLLMLTLLPLSGANAEQTRSVLGGTLYDLQCFGNHTLQLGTVNTLTGEVTKIGQPLLKEVTLINTCRTLVAKDISDTSDIGYVIATILGPTNIIYSLNFATGAMSAGRSLDLDPKPGSRETVFGFTADSGTNSFYVLYLRTTNGTHDGIHVAKIDPATSTIISRNFVSDANSLFARSTAPGFVMSGFAYNPVDSKIYIATGDSDTGTKNTGLYHLWTLDPTSGTLVDLAQTPSPQSANADNITPHSFFSIAFDYAGTIWGVGNSIPQGKVVTKSATVSGWGAPNDLSLSTARVKAQEDGEYDQLVFVPFVPCGPLTPLVIQATCAAKIAAAAAAAAPSAAQIAAAEAAAKRAAEIAAAEARAAAIATAQTTLATVLKGDKAGTLSEYRSANINVTTAAALTRLNAEVLKFSAADRSDFAKIKAIADKIEFDESFFNATARPTLATYASNGVQVTDRTLETINAKILELPAAQRTDITAIAEIAKVETFVDRVANPATRSSVSAATLITKGLLPAESPYKFTVVQRLASYPEGSLNSMAKIEAAVKEQIVKAEAPKRRLAEIKAKIQARRK